MTRLASVTVHALSAGYLTLPERFFVTPLEDPNSRKTVPSLSFLVVHTNHLTGEVTRFVFDLGIRKRIEEYSKQIFDHASTRKPISGMPDVVQSLANGDLTPADIDGVIFSHLHWDHIGTPSDFDASAFIIGPGAGKLLDKAPQGRSSHNHFEPGLLDPKRTIELGSTSDKFMSNKYLNTSLPPRLRPLADRLSKNWQRLGPFEHTIDVFGDSSLFLVSAPGHLDGHINLLCRTALGRHVYLAGDACHDTRLLTGEKEVATWLDESHSVCCIHSDKTKAEQTLFTIREAISNPGPLGHLEVVFAHDLEWERESRDANRFFPGAL